MLHIHLLGRFQLFYNQQPVTALTARDQAIVAYLLLRRYQSVTREELAFTLWPETNDRQARTNLRTALTRLRRTLPGLDQYVWDEHGLLQWRADAPFTLDVLAFEVALRQAEQAEQAGDDVGALAHYQAAIAHYTGDLLHNVYEEWVMSARQRLSEQFVGALESVIGLLQQRREYRQAIRYTQQLLRYDPLHETSYRQLMEIHAQNGDHANAKRIYDACTTILQRELGVTPSPLTQQRYRALVQGA